MSIKINYTSFSSTHSQKNAVYFIVEIKNVLSGLMEMSDFMSDFLRTNSGVMSGCIRLFKRTG